MVAADQLSGGSNYTTPETREERKMSDMQKNKGITRISSLSERGGVPGTSRSDLPARGTAAGPADTAALRTPAFIAGLR